MHCPVCDEKLREVEKSGVSVDICPGCKGIWLDRGELEKLIEMSQSEGNYSDSRESQDRRRQSVDDADQPRCNHRQDGHSDHDRGDKHDDDHSEKRDKDGHDTQGYGRPKKKGSWLADIIGGFGEGGD
jgi:uncharacterized protein